MEKVRKIIHIDMDYFFAQVEERENPKLRKMPVGVGGVSSRRGILCTCNYIARKFGVRGAMPTFKAISLCPQLVLVKPNFKLYKEASVEIFNIFSNYTDCIEGISLDEAYLDVTSVSRLHNSGTLIAKEIKDKILKQTGLTASAGISFNKLFSKIASEYNKPNGILTITPEMASEFMLPLKVNLINGVGKKTYEKLIDLGINTFSDLQKWSPNDLEYHFGSYGHKLHQYSFGIDNREVINSRERKSLSVEKTFMTNVNYISVLKSYFIDVHAEMLRRLEKHQDRKIKTVFIKIKFFDFTQLTMEIATNSCPLEIYWNLMSEKFKRIEKPIRLVGVGVKFVSEVSLSKQLYLPCCA